MSNTIGDRFDDYSQLEEFVFERFLTEFEETLPFQGIRDTLTPYYSHPCGTDDFDILCNTEVGKIKFEIQVSEDFEKYGDLRIYPSYLINHNI